MPTAELFGQPTIRNLLLGFMENRLPQYKPRQAQTSAPQGAFSFTQTAPSGPGNRILDTANKYLGVPYVWGGTSSRGIDCSGLTYLTAKQLGYNIPRTAKAQYMAMTKVSNPQPGDYVFVKTKASQGYHVGIYVGNNKFLNAPHTGAQVRVDDLSKRQIIGFTRLG